MKTEWICRWQLIPGGKEQVKAYPTQEDAKKAMAKVLTDAADLKGYIDALRKECPMLVVSHPYYGDDNYPFIVDFSFEYPHDLGNRRVNAVWIQINERIDYGNSANPFLVLWALEKDPQTQDQISEKILEKWDTSIERKAVGRHLQLLQDLGFPVLHGPEGYCRGGEAGEPRTDIQYSPSAYPFLILKVLDNTPKTKAAIIQAIQEKFSTKIDRNTVVRNLELLAALGYEIQKHEDGYYIDK